MEGISTESQEQSITAENSNANFQIPNIKREM
jgi:hypothetical protein